MLFLNTKLTNVYFPAGPDQAPAQCLTATPPEHLRYVGPLLPDGSVPQD